MAVADLLPFLVALALSGVLDGLETRVAYTAEFLCCVVDWLFVAKEGQW